MQINSSYNPISYRQNIKNTPMRSQGLKADTASFGNQTTRGVTSKAVSVLDETLENDNLPSKLLNKLRGDFDKYSDIQETRWRGGNRRYHGKDEKKW